MTLQGHMSCEDWVWSSRGAEGYRGVRCGNGTVAKKALLYESVLNVNHPPV